MEFLHLLNVNKPAGMTSRDVVNHVQRLIRPAKIGHAGTLDPLATGVLILCLGQATRLIDYVQRQPKSYRGTFLLGRSSDTEDVEGQVAVLPNPPQPTLGEVTAALPRFTGPLLQRPPAFSALKVQGRRAYDLARQGREVELAPRPIEIHSLRIVRYDYPELVLDIECSSGTYVRSLGRDLAESLGTAAVMSALQRTAIGPFAIAAAVDLSQITATTLSQHVLPPDVALRDLPRVELTAEDERTLTLGQPLRRTLSPTLSNAAEIAGYTAQGRLFSILRPDPTGVLKPHLNFLPVERR